VAPEKRAATLEELKALRESLNDVRQVMERQVQETVAEVSVPRQEFRTRLRRSFWSILVIMAVVVVVAVGVNRVTLLQAQRAFGEQVTRCFLRPSQITAAQRRECDQQFSQGDHAYLKLQEQSRAATARFLDLQRWAQSKGWQPSP
jgi:hypothetical protein